MISYIADPKSNFMEFIIRGKVSTEEYDLVMKEFKKDLHQFENIKMLGLVEELGGIDPMVFVKDFGFMMSEFGTVNEKIKKCAVVAKEKWIEMMTKPFTSFLKGEIRFFSPGEEAQAREWLKS